MKVFFRALLIQAALVAPAAGASFTLLPSWFSDPSIRGIWMMPDGESFAGVDGIDVFRWSPSNGRQNVGQLPLELLNLPTQPTAISDDGSTIIGYLGPYDGIAPGFKWTVEDGASTILGSTTETIVSTIPTAVSSDGSVIVGTAKRIRAFEPIESIGFRWSESSGTVPLEEVQNPTAVSADGLTVVGWGPFGGYEHHALHWTASGGATGLGIFPDSWQPASGADLVSADGSVVVGSGFPPDAQMGPKVFRWTSESGLTPISVEGAVQGLAGISANGNTIVGTMGSYRDDLDRFAIYTDVYVWSTTAGMETLQEILVRHGVSDLGLLARDQVNLFPGALDVSDDGLKVFGRTTTTTTSFTNLTYMSQWWLADLSVVPEPRSAALFVVGLIALFATRSRRKSTRC